MSCRVGTRSPMFLQLILFGTLSASSVAGYQSPDFGTTVQDHSHSAGRFPGLGQCLYTLSWSRLVPLGELACRFLSKNVEHSKVPGHSRKFSDSFLPPGL